MVRIKWLRSAKIDLKEIYDFISLDSKRYARFQIEKIQNKTEILKTGMIIGKRVSEIDNDNVREIFEGNYRIIYRIISKNEIHILLVHHGAKDILQRMK
ncbi:MULTISPECIES: type II toxin-antitoxin system RelE/ParE family toxin [Chryseobacterium]|jgi:addiction module RelE/StbE family toxin|uniref:type II toxin-antitoxin system RelE/ParE family toxin n=1 Tax=Chryseobacterium TaxID=59732 RepID=UPI000E27BA7A|nr:MULTISPECIES: type II toxin-antitoxin system RelE/ParE family toxin [Chryseobacterium]MDF2831812.1 type toxin-antitoxin system RelE/ParE family toxin [Chryseobacterium indoltheticum]REC42138.1 type II toxin-antitoxin system RelE/ParE family toxin [Chryseobacterium sp. 5_R23647]